ncbi:membrane protein insertase YidC [Nocardioides sp. BP30]|uniref:membrane protein insertase YidC n=1 Tax=Nocardioides sp. BP30 TaxID=3036374 RepID=UPI002469BD98|nr:membrane protein insertase YidC [Nocardioides sp. BP30]WGL52548.1 membrane protein insertase YidC [Nocardioides sp. BP30]
MGAIGQLFGWIATPLYYAISGILLFWHKLATLVLSPSNGWSWVLAIVGLTVTIRALLIPLFVKQIKSSRNMQLIQPKVKELQKKYGHDRERLAQETMKLYKDTGTNPFASCLPLLIQMPIFLCLFRLVNSAAHGTARGFLSSDDVQHFSNARIFGARLADTFNGTDDTSVKILAAVLVVAMCVTTFLTQRQLMAKNMPADAMQGQYAQQQKMLLYVLPFVFAISGIAFPIAAMLYWTTSNLWTMGQQFYVIRNSPAPGTPAEKAKQERDREKAARKAARHGGTVAAVDTVEARPEAGPEVTERPAARAQPKKQTRSQRKGKR